MTSTRILLLCILGLVLLSSVICDNGVAPDDYGGGFPTCCFNHSPQRLNINMISSYYMTDHRCPRPGVILVTKRSRHICVDPDQAWVVSIMKSLDESTF